MRIAVDTNRYSDFARGEKRAVDVIRSAAEIVVPLIVLAELRGGFAHGTRRETNERNLVKFLDSRRVSVVSPDEQTTHFYADVFADLRRRGKPIPTNDMWIAALVIQHDLVLFDRDKDFDHIPRLARI